jgi:hypothetical protein
MRIGNSGPKAFRSASKKTPWTPFPAGLRWSPHEKPGGEGQQREHERRGVVHAGEELLGNDGEQRAVEVEVVPLEHGAQRRSENDALVRGVDALAPFSHSKPLCSFRP